MRELPASLWAARRPIAQVDIKASPQLPTLAIRSVYLDQVSDLAPAGGLVDREDELRGLAEFCAGDEPYMWWQGPPWAGKTALLSSFALNPPAGVRVISFFVTARLAGQADGSAFTDALLYQLPLLIGEEPPMWTSPTLRDAYRRRLLREAAFFVHQAGERLVLVVDGLDEDSGGRSEGLPSIASLLPKTCHHGLSVIVSSREHYLIPSDVSLDHPLFSCRIRSLRPSPYSVGIEREARNELQNLYRKDSAHRDVVGLVVASGSLSIADLEVLAGLPRDEVSRLFDGMLGRTMKESKNTIGTQAPHVYSFAHESLREEAINTLGAYQIFQYKTRIHDWADDFREAGWPQNTPDFLLTGYARTLGESAQEVQELARLADDMQRHARQRERLLGDSAALFEIDAAQRMLSAEVSPDMGMIAALTIRRYQLTTFNEAVPGTLPAVWVRLGEIETAKAIAFGIGGSFQDFALVGLATSLAEVRRQAEAEQVANAIQEPWCKANAFASVGQVQYVHDPHRALILVEQAKQIARSIRRGPQRIQALISIAIALQQIDPDSCLSMVAEAEEYVRENVTVDDRIMSASVLKNLLVEELVSLNIEWAESVADRLGCSSNSRRFNEAQNRVVLRQAIENAEDNALEDIVAETERDLLSADSSVTQGTELVYFCKILCDRQLWEHAERIARRVSHPYYQVRALSTLALNVAESDPERARSLAIECGEVARKWQPMLWLAEVLLGLFDCCVEARSWERAERVAHAMRPDFARLELASRRASALAEARLWDEAERVTREIEAVPGRIAAWSDLVRFMGAEDPGRAMRISAEAEQLCSTLEAARSRDDCLSRLASALAEARLWDEAERVTREIDPRWDNFYSTALTSLLSQLTAAIKSGRDEQARLMALQRARKIIASDLAGTGFARSLKVLGAISCEEGNYVFDMVDSRIKIRKYNDTR